MGLGIFGGNSSSQSSSTTNNMDQRVVADGGSVGLSGNSSTFNISQTDGGITARALDSLDKNFKLVNDSAGEGISSLLGAMKSMFETSTTQATSMAGTVEKNVLDAYRNAASDAKGTIDNKTIIALAVAGVAVVGFIYMRRAA